MDEEIIISLLNNEFCLDEKCWVCEGNTQQPKSGWLTEDGTCENCGGTGYTLTGNGEAILALIKRHGNRTDI